MYSSIDFPDTKAIKSNFLKLGWMIILLIGINFLACSKEIVLIDSAKFEKEYKTVIKLNEQACKISNSDKTAYLSLKGKALDLINQYNYESGFIKKSNWIDSNLPKQLNIKAFDCLR